MNFLKVMIRSRSLGDKLEKCFFLDLTFGFAFISEMYLLAMKYWSGASITFIISHFLFHY